MRVIAGKYRGRRLLSPEGNDVRPTTDKIKEALYNVLQSEIEGAVVIDLFCGSGGLGIEALSRGAKKVYFCDVDHRSVSLTKTNLSFVPSSDYELIKGDYADCLRRLACRGVKADIILCDPPYKLKKGGEILTEIVRTGILTEGGTVTVERATDDGPVEEGELFPTDTKRYSNTSIDIFKRYEKVAVTGTFDPFTLGHKYLVEQGLERFDAVYVVLLKNPDKEETFSLEARKKIAELSLKEYKRRVKVDFYDGLTVDYCKKHGIRYIIRGVRDEKDEAYEREMADWNKSHGDVETILVPAADPTVSSTAVRRRLDGEESAPALYDLMTPEAVEYVNKLRKIR
ncbi:MAG: 16S rRNA (guanine(966)-N(2))-methyltransferase RsmD [Clostridia bacterium]|nr:16S rRNA (guanine(966)-N(2))-methyltransferase RsmD [Clostridia bacterium]